MQSVAIVIPCYNEASRLDRDAFRSFLSTSPVHIVFVDDGSKDDTLSVLKTLQGSFPEKIHILHTDYNEGKAEAVRKGIMKVSCQDEFDIIGFMDADLSTPFSELRYFWEAFDDKRIEFVFGSRISRIGAHIKRFPHRHYLGRVIATIISVYLKIPVYDSQCGAKFFQADFAKMLFAERFVSRWLFDVEIFRRIALTGIEVGDCAMELPLHTWIDKSGSKIGLRDIFRLPMEFSRIFWYYHRRANFTHRKTEFTEIVETSYLEEV